MKATITVWKASAPQIAGVAAKAPRSPIAADSSSSTGAEPRSW